MSKVKYKKNNNVLIEMDIQSYRNLLKSYNDLKSILSTVFECHDMYISDVQKLESLRYRLDDLGFVAGKQWYNDATLPKGGK